MITELGHFALILALFVAIIQATVPLAGAARRQLGWMAAGRSCALIGFGLTALAMLALMHAYVTSDFSVLNVYENSNSTMPLVYRLTSIWGNHEGSMMLWVFILALFGALVAAFGGRGALVPGSVRRRAPVGGVVCDRFDRARTGTARALRRFFT